jgi:hypothetical protein
MNVQRVALAGCLAVVVAAVVAGLWLGGSPAEQRWLRLDEQRVFELTQLANAAERRWDREQRLVDTAAGLVDGQILTRLPTDPTTREPYEYRVTGPRQFEVCATFDRSSRPELAGDFWFHEAGYRCFTFDVTERRDGSP